MVKLYWYITAISTVKPGASLTSFVRALQDLKVDKVDYNEETRRVLHRFPLTKLPAIVSLWERYASITSYELKASGKAGSFRVSVLRRVFAQAEETPAAILVLDSCDKGYSVYAEIRNRRAMLKLCRREAIEASVTSLPPSLCEWFYPGTNPLDMVRIAQECITSFYEKLLSAKRGGESA